MSKVRLIITFDDSLPSIKSVTGNFSGWFVPWNVLLHLMKMVMSRPWRVNKSLNFPILGYLWLGSAILSTVTGYRTNRLRRNMCIFLEHYRAVISVNSFDPRRLMINLLYYFMVMWLALFTDHV